VKIKYALILSTVLICSCQSNQEESPDNSALESATSESKSPEKASSENDNSQVLNDSLLDERVKLGFESAANAFMNSYRQEKFLEFAKYMHPAVVKAFGGPAAFAEQTQKGKSQDKQVYRKWECGPLEKFKTIRDDRGRITGWYCVVPIKRWLEGRPDHQFQMQWLGGQCLNAKDFHFIDITDGDKDLIYRIMPDMRFLLENLPVRGEND
jgi:hypothetical protein